MKIKEITITLQRPIRHARYRVSTPSVTLTGVVEANEDPNDAAKELLADCKYLLNEAIEENIQLYVETEQQIKDKQADLLKQTLEKRTNDES